MHKQTYFKKYSTEKDYFWIVKTGKHLCVTFIMVVNLYKIYQVYFLLSWSWFTTYSVCTSSKNLIFWGQKDQWKLKFILMLKLKKILSYVMKIKSYNFSANFLWIIPYFFKKELSSIVNKLTPLANWAWFPCFSTNVFCWSITGGPWRHILTSVILLASDVLYHHPAGFAALIINDMFMFDKMFQPNASKFANYIL